jgi:glutamate synthase (NADPH/NADH) large chain
VHHHLIRKGLRTSVGLVVETGEAREVHHFCLPRRLWRRGDQPLSGLRHAARHARQGRFPADEVDRYEVVERYIKSIGKGILKVMSKMGISTYQSYCGAQIFDAVGLSSEFVDEVSSPARRRPSRASACRGRRGDRRASQRAFSNDPVLRNAGGRRRVHVPRARRGAHVWTPDIVASLQHAVRGNLPEKYREFAAGERRARPPPIRGLFRIKNADEIGRKPVPSTRSSRPEKSSSASPPAPCPSARSRARRTRRWRWP